MKQNIPNNLCSNLCSRIHKIFGLGVPPVLVFSKLEPLLKSISDMELVNIIEEVLIDKEKLSVIASNSHFQGNGFVKIVLQKNNHYSLRMHVWMPSLESQENLHSHRWYFASKIITGSLLTEIWQDSISINTPSYDEYCYESKYRNLRYAGTTHVELLEARVNRQGETYVMGPDTLHRIVKTPGNLVATLMVRSRPCRDSARNVVVNDHVPSVRPVSISVTELEEVLYDLLRELE